jgi:pyruvate/2-oxoglutarate dehydrogenase complex dihydrolipoamide dehydrogenase (E3) component
MPSKTLLESAHRAQTIRRAAEFGLKGSFDGADGAAIIERKCRLIEEFAGYRRTQLETGKFDFIRGRARFLDPHRVEITDREGGTREVTSRAVLIAAGSTISHVPIEGLKEVGCLTSDEVLDSSRIPRSVVILGGGAIALEFASYYAGLCVETTVIQRGPQVLREMDGDIAEALTEALERQGIRIFRNTSLRFARRAGELKEIGFDHAGQLHTVEAEEIIYALGRRPNTDGLQLERAAVQFGRKGISTETTQQTNQPHIFAAGDISGPLEVVHVAIQQGEIAARNAARLIRGSAEPLERMDYALKLFAVFTQPEVAAVGRTEWEAADDECDVLVSRYPFIDHGKSLVRGETDGFVKLIVERESRKILGASVIGPDASELIHEIAVAMHFRATAGDLARVPHYHPTLSEIWTYPAEELAG